MPSFLRNARVFAGIIAVMTFCARFSAAAVVEVNFQRTNGTIRPLHGGNNGPLCYGELVDLTAFHRELRIPFTRLHDSAWPYPDIVDVHAIFPDFDADPSREQSYRFGPTDDYLRAITNTGARIVYRLGESIEHAKRKRYVHPPRDPEKWAQICVNIIRHYNEGWAGGHRLGIDYWEIWNEPENRPAMWTGTPEQYFRLYSTAAKAIKTRWPTLKVGGPSLGHQGEFKDGVLKPSDFLRDFLAHLRREQVPLDFFSWHLYSNDPAEPARRAKAVRAFLDAHGLRAVESHLNEWNYLPDNNWKPSTSGPGEARERWYARMGDAEGAAFTACALIGLQDAPLNVANYYSADNQPFGIFTLHGAPKKSYFALKAFAELAALPVRVEARGADAGRTAVLGASRPDKSTAAVLLGNFSSPDAQFAIHLEGLAWAGATHAELLQLDAGRNLESIRTLVLKTGVLTLELPAPAVALIRLRPASATAR